MTFTEKKDEFKEFYAENYNLLTSAEKAFKNLIYLLLSNSSEITTPSLSSRVKNRNESVKKFDLKYRKKLENNNEEYRISEHITDLIGIRIITHYESDIEKVVRILKANFDVLDITDKTAQLQEKGDTFGYKGIHLDVKLSKHRIALPEYEEISDFQFEVQVRSIVQNAWSEIDHKLKYKRSLSDELKRRVINLAALFELADREFDSIRTDTASEVENKTKEEFESSEFLTSFGLLKKFQKVYPHFPFDDFKIEGFFDEVFQLKPLTFGQLEKIYQLHYEFVNDYKSYREQVFNDVMNPFTVLRHMLYLHNSRVYESLLFKLQRDTFSDWLLGTPRNKNSQIKRTLKETEATIIEFIVRMSENSSNIGWVYLGTVKALKTYPFSYSPKLNNLLFSLGLAPMKIL